MSHSFETLLTELLAPITSLPLHHHGSASDSVMSHNLLSFVSIYG